MRVFVALYPPAVAAEQLDAAVRSVAAGVPAAAGGRGSPALRWVPAGQRHITLAFYGEVPAGAVDGLGADLASACADLVPFPVRLRGAGVFSQRVLWAGVQEPGGEGSGSRMAAHGSSSGRLMELMRVCEDVGARYGRNLTAAEERSRRRAHVTVARIRGGRRAESGLRACAQALAVYEGPVWIAYTAHLMLSEPRRGKGGGPLHTTLCELELRG